MNGPRALILPALASAFLWAAAPGHAAELPVADAPGGPAAGPAAPAAAPGTSVTAVPTATGAAPAAKAKAIPGLHRAYVDTVYQANGVPAAGRKRFGSDAEAEFTLDYKRVQLNLEVELGLAGAGSGNAVVEQAFLRVPLGSGGYAFVAGSFYDPLGLEHEDAPDRDQITHGQIYTLLNSQTRLPGNNVQGMAVQGALGHSSFMAALLNDLGGVPNRHSLAVMLATSPAEHLRLQGGFATQAHLDANPASAETLLNLSAVWSAERYFAAVEYLSGDKLIDSVFSVTADYRWTRFLTALRWDSARYLITNVSGTTTLTATAAYLPAPGYKLALEFRRNTNPNTVPTVLPLPPDGNAVLVQALAVF